jgi:hypothetical protein
LRDISVVALISDKAQHLSHGAYRRIEKERIGKRQFVILEARR